MDSSYLSFAHVRKYYGQNKALDDFSMLIQPGERVALLGINGAGKSTLVSLATGIRKPDAGRVRLFGGLPHQKTNKQGLGYLSQSNELPQFLKVEEVLNVVASHYARPYRECIDLLDISSFLHKKIGSLSGGQHRRVAMAASLIGGPQFVIMDEPTVGMDIGMRSQTFDMLKEYFSENDRSILFSTHHMDEVDKLADRVLVIHNGRLLAQGSVSEIKKKYGLREVSFHSKEKGVSIPSARYLFREEEFYRAVGLDSDRILREVMEQVPDASAFTIKEPDLEEIFVTLTRASA